MDAWLVAFKIPNFLRRLFAEGSFSQAFVPVISEYKVKRSQDEVRELVDGVAGTFGVMLFVVTLIGVIAAPLIILAFAPGLARRAGQVRTWPSSMLRWTFPYLFFISLSALFSGVLNSYGQLRAAGVHAGDHERGHDRRARCGSRRTPRTRASRWPWACS